ncbi:MAG: Smr/MutS family protein, partial [Gammaproteobacteria bacterium]|nr:Smr/MutS family protein [Gammaproteobacteria bacterium]
ARARALDAREPGPPLRVEPGTEVADRLEFRRAGVRDRQYLKLRRGGLHAEDRLDLHGLTQADAQPELEGFLEASRARGLRCVLVVHGKGMRSAGRGPVLKAAVDLWLRRHNDVLAFATARPIDGGGGALYVLLRA